MLSIKYVATTTTTTPNTFSAKIASGKAGSLGCAIDPDTMLVCFHPHPTSPMSLCLGKVGF